MCWWRSSQGSLICSLKVILYSVQIFTRKLPLYTSQKFGRNIAKVILTMLHVILLFSQLKELLLYWRALFAFCASAKKSSWHVLQLFILLGQLYGTIVYFVTSYLDGDNFATNQLRKRVGF